MVDQVGLKGPAALDKGFANSVSTLTAEPLVVLNYSIYVQIVLGVLFLMLSFVVANTANQTVVMFTTAAILISFPLWSYYAIHRFATHVTIGATLGAGLLVVLLCLQTSVYWGSLSVCQKLTYSIKQYSCNSKVTYRSICIVGIFLFVVHLLFVILLAQFRGAVLKDVEEYEKIFDDDEKEYHFERTPSVPSPGGRDPSSSTPGNSRSVDL